MGNLKKSQWSAYSIKLEPSLNGSDSPFFKAAYDFYLVWTNEADEISVQTSGSTGTPKKIAIAKTAMLESARQTIAFFKITENQNLLLCLPVDFIAGKMMMVRAMLSGATLVLAEPAANPLLHVQPLPLDFAAFTPQQVATIISDPETRKKFAAIKKVIIGGGEISHQLEKKLGSFPNEIYATYGMTETITHVAVRKLVPIAIGNPDKIYKVFKGIRIGLDERQCLTIAAPYLGSEPIVTNDLVEVQGPHEFSWLGRYDNVVNSGGIKLFPEKIEEKLRELIPHAFFLAGVPDEVLGEKLVMVIESGPFDKTTLGLLHSSLKDQLDKYEVPKEIVFVQQFERTETDKIRRKKTLELAQKSLN